MFLLFEDHPQITQITQIEKHQRAALPQHKAESLWLTVGGHLIHLRLRTGDTATNTISGTSMATPHVVGVIALYLQLNPGANPAQVQTAIKNLSTKGGVTGTDGGLLGGRSTPNNHLLFTNF